MRKKLSRYTYGDIPDAIRTKQMLPIGEHVWRLICQYGWEWFRKQTTDKTINFYPNLGDAINEKFQNSVVAADKVIKGQIENPEEVYSTWFFPPLIYVRSDLQTGTTKLIYGDSTDITFVLSDDSTSEVELLINGHMEQGIPMDYWYIKGDDEIFDRRHIKLGYKLREIPKRTKDFTKSGLQIIDILRDVRNERSPQWSGSTYSMCMVWVSGGINITCEPTNWGDLADVWDGLSAKKVYGAPDYWFCYVPWPPLLGMLMNIGRAGWTVRMSGLLTNHHLFINAFEPKHKRLFKEGTPEIWDYMVRDLKERGAATPQMTLGCTPPNLKDKKTQAFDWSFPDEARIKPFDWGLTEDEIFGGLITDITHDTPAEPSYGKEHLVSVGIGKL